MPTWVKGFDIAFSRLSRPWLKARYLEGNRVIVQNLWTGGYGNNARLREIAEANLADAYAEGFLIAGYANANPWYPVYKCMAEIKLNAGKMWDVLRVVAEDVEIPLVTEAQVHDLCLALEGEGKLVPIYSAAWFWKETIGNPTWPWAKEHKLWEAYYDYDPDIDFLNRRFGPWELADIMGEQYQGTTILDGVDVDLNIFDLDYWGVDMGVDQEARDLIAALTGRLASLEEALAGQKDYIRFDGFPEIYEVVGVELFHISNPPALFAQTKWANVRLIKPGTDDWNVFKSFAVHYGVVPAKMLS